MATERIITLSRTSQQTSLKRKFSQYDRYLRSSRYAQKYKQYGDFGYFTMLFVTFGEERVQHIRRETRDLATELDDYYRLTPGSRGSGRVRGFLLRQSSRLCRCGDMR
jgi:hypothetical protein